MSKCWRTGTLAAFILILAVAMVASPSLRQSAFGKTVDEQKSAGGAHYTVVMTEGHNLLVTDNGANKLYFYTIDKDKPIGSPLKLRASVDLAKVGQEEIHITPHNLEKLDK
jgi:6-phosphogluconolactonase (cycloisomerase 2 family)